MPEDDRGQNDPPNVVSLTDTNAKIARKRLPFFIRSNTAAIVSEWEAFARTLAPSAEGMTPHALRDHIHQILAFIESDIISYQTLTEQTEKSHGEKKQSQPVTAAQTHAAIRFAGGFDIGQMTSEYRALRASVLKLWTKTAPAFDAQDIADMTRFNELSIRNCPNPSTSTQKGWHSPESWWSGSLATTFVARCRRSPWRRSFPCTWDRVKNGRLC